MPEEEPESATTDDVRPKVEPRFALSRKEQKELDREIPWSLIPVAEREAYAEALAKEWNSWLRFEAVNILSEEASRAVTQYFNKTRVLSTRVCYRNKNAATPWLGLKAKARLVCRGDQDPDLLTLRRDAPTLTRAGFCIILQICSSFNWTLFGGDITGAFLQGDQDLAKRREPLFLRQPKEGLPGLRPGQLLMVMRGIFSLANSP